jgi:hypothetical protein
MNGWIACGKNFIEADVIRFREPVWENRGPRQRKGLKVMGRKIGERTVTAQVIAEDEEAGYVLLLIEACEVHRDKALLQNIDVMILNKGEERWRARKTIERRGPERQLWQDETARAVAVRDRAFIAANTAPRKRWDRNKDSVD